MSLASTARLCAVLALPLAAGCVQPQRPYTFSAPPGAEAPIDTLVRAMATEGLQPAIIAPHLGIVHSRWDHQGECYMPDQRNGTLMRRFTAAVAPTTSSGNTVTVRADVQCCESGEVSADGSLVRGPCAVLPQIFEAHQREVDELGFALQQAMAHSAQ